jgi:hypothetical protein
MAINFDLSDMAILVWSPDNAGSTICIFGIDINVILCDFRLRAIYRSSAANIQRLYGNKRLQKKKTCPALMDWSVGM